MPVTTPPETDAVPEALEAQVPPGVASVSVVIDPVQTLIAPDGAMAAGPALTLTVAIDEHAPTV